MKKVLILCTGNSCRSIISEALINHKMGDRFSAVSSGVEASGTVNPGAIAALKRKKIPVEGLHSKKLKSMLDQSYDLVVTVCDHAKENCPVFPKPAPKIHLGLKDASEDSSEEYDRICRDAEVIVLAGVLEFFK